MSSYNDYLSALERVVAAVRCLVYVQDYKPGQDLGQRDSAISWLELRASLSALMLIDKDEGGFASFDVKAALEELQQKYGKK